MKICCIADGISIHTQRWVNYFALKGHEVHLISTRFAAGYEGYDQRIRMYPLIRLLPRVWKVSGYLSALLWLLQVRRLVRKIGPDIVDAHFITVNGYLGVASGFHPIILTAWGSDILIDPKRNPLRRLLTRYALKKADVIVCRSSPLREEIVRLRGHPSKVRTILIGVDTAKFNPNQRDEEMKQVLGIGRCRPVVISTRKLAPIYAVETLIRAIPLVLTEIRQAKFIIAGTGTQRSYLESLSQSLGISENVKFVDWVPHDELPKYLASADVYVSTSVSDGVSNSLLEAMACRLAPVVSDVPANRIWIEDGHNGFLVPVRDYQTLAARVVCLLKMDELRAKFGKICRETVRRRAEHEAEMEKAQKLYEETIAKY